MKRKMGLVELAQYTYRGLQRQGIEVVLSGGACVSIYTQNAYQSWDLDFIRELHVAFEIVSVAMETMGFERKGRHFIHPDSEFFVEFPPPPLTVGEEKPTTIKTHMLRTPLGKFSIKMLSPTDCVKDRLCGYYYWNDKQCLDQALLVSQAKKIDLQDIENWSQREKMTGKFLEFKRELKIGRNAKITKKKPR